MFKYRYGVYREYKLFGNKSQNHDTIKLSYLYTHIIFILNAISTYHGTQINPSLLHKYSPSSLATDIPLTERQRLRDGHLSMPMRFFSSPTGIGPESQLIAIISGHPSPKYLLVSGIEPKSSVFLVECVTH